MPRGRKLAALELTGEQRAQLESVAQSTSMSHGLVQRARIVLACAEVVTNAKVAEQLGVSASTVGKHRPTWTSSGHGQLCNTQPRQRTCMAGETTPISCSLHPHIRLLDELGGALVRPYQSTSYQAGLVPERDRPDQDHP